MWWCACGRCVCAGRGVREACATEVDAKARADGLRGAYVEAVLRVRVGETADAAGGRAVVAAARPGRAVKRVTARTPCSVARASGACARRCKTMCETPPVIRAADPAWGRLN